MEPPSLLDGGWRLCSRRTQERLLLPPPKGGAWTLSFDARGLGVLDESGGNEAIEPRWAVEFLKVVLYKNGSGEQKLRGRTGETMELGSHQGDCYESVLQLRLGDARATADKSVRCGCFRPQEGCRLWWAAGDLYSLANMDVKKYASRWLSKGWRVLAGFLGDLGLSPRHCRQSNHAGVDPLRGAVLSFCSLSTVGLLAALSRWCQMDRALGGLKETRGGNLVCGGCIRTLREAFAEGSVSRGLVWVWV